MTGRAAVWMLIVCSPVLAQLQLTDLSTNTVCYPAAAIDLGSIGLTGTTTAFQITNTGTTGVELDTLAIQGAGFGLVMSGSLSLTLPLTLASGAWVSFTVTLTPAGIGAYSGPCPSTRIRTWFLRTCCHSISR